MLFVLRTIFWLSIAAAIVPHRDGGSDIIADMGRAGGEAVSEFCMDRAADCIAGARHAVRIGQTIMGSETGAVVDPAPVATPAVARVPLPVARPQG